MRSARLLVPWLPVALWMALIFFLSSRPSADYPDAGFLAAKGMHLFLYAVLAFTAYRALRLQRVEPGSARILAWLIAVVYGMTDELHQTFVPTRAGSPVDVAIDGVGAVIGLVVAHVLYERWARQRDLTK